MIISHMEYLEAIRVVRWAGGGEINELLTSLVEVVCSGSVNDEACKLAILNST